VPQPAIRRRDTNRALRSESQVLGTERVMCGFVCVAANLFVRMWEKKKPGIAPGPFCDDASRRLG
jgi:hypothetical protein